MSRYRKDGPEGVQGRSSAPANRPTHLPLHAIEKIETWRRQRTWPARCIVRELAEQPGIACTVRTVRTIMCWSDRLGLNRIRDITSGGQDLRQPGRIIARYPGDMIHMDVGKVGRIPDGGGWRAHGHGSQSVLAGKRQRKQARLGYTYLHSMGDGFSRLAYIEALEDEKAVTTIGFFHRARAFFAVHGITRITRLVTDNGANYTSTAFGRSTRAYISTHQRIRPHTPRHHGKIERYQRILTEKCLYARTYRCEIERREALSIWNHHYNYHRPHTACGDQPPGLTPPRTRRQRHDQLHLARRTSFAALRCHPPTTEPRHPSRVPGLRASAGPMESAVLIRGARWARAV